MDARAFYLDGEMYLFQGTGYIRIHQQDPEKISHAKQMIDLNPNNNFLLLGTY